MANRVYLAFLALGILGGLTSCAPPLYLRVGSANLEVSPSAPVAQYFANPDSTSVDVTIRSTDPNPRPLFVTITNSDVVTQISTPTISNRGTATLPSTPQEFFAQENFRRAQELLANGGMVAPGSRAVIVDKNYTDAEEGDTTSYSFPDYQAGTNVTQNLTLRYRGLLGAGPPELLIWAENTWWANVSGAPEISESVADYFTQVIYSETKNLIGEPWGSHGYSSLVSGEIDQIHIILGKTEKADYHPSNPAIVGFFYNRDLTITDSDSFQAPVIVINAGMLGWDWDGSGGVGSWYWRVGISTLAHELQHLTNFYQRTVVRGSTTPIWLDELSSLMIEDGLTSALNTGLAILDPAETSPGFDLPGVDRYSQAIGALEVPIVKWATNADSIDELLAHYGVAALFGTYLHRNTTQEGLLGTLMTSGLSGASALDQALRDTGVDGGLPGALSRWVPAVLLSEASASNLEGYRMSTKAAVGTDPTFGEFVAPSPLPYSEGGGNDNGFYWGFSLQPSSTLVHRLDPEFVGQRTWRIETPPGSVLTFVLK